MIDPKWDADDPDTIELVFHAIYGRSPEDGENAVDLIYAARNVLNEERNHVYHSPRFDVVMYDDGARWAVHDNTKKVSMFLEGKEAARFRQELEEFLSSLFPAMSAYPIIVQWVRE